MSDCKPAPIKPSLPRCDCLNSCGDDPRVRKGTARPCEARVNRERSEALQNRRAAAERHAMQTLHKIAMLDPTQICTADIVKLARDACVDLAPAA